MSIQREEKKKKGLRRTEKMLICLIIRRHRSLLRLWLDFLKRECVCVFFLLLAWFDDFVFFGAWAIGNVFLFARF